MQRWLMSPQKFRFKPSVMTSRPPSRHHPGFWCSFIRVSGHRSGLSQAFGGQFNHQRHHGIVEPVSERFLPSPAPGSRSRFQVMANTRETHSQTDSDPVAASDPDDGRHAGSKGKEQALARSTSRKRSVPSCSANI